MEANTATRPGTLGALRATAYRPRSVKAEVRENLVRRLRSREPVFPGLVGYEDTVIPELVNALLAQHDLLLLGLRGQAKTRILRALPELLDEYIPVVAGLDVWDDPLAPQLEQTRALIRELGDETPLRWVHRSARYHEKLATPDVTIADLLGEIDLVKHAEGRRLADEGVLHYGLIPRSNRGIFAINELPDLAPRIQVGLFNVLEERDVQIRGFPVRLKLDLLLAFSANPEDYTNRGRIVTPLKDRIGSVIRTHYPYSLAEALRITRASARLDRAGDGPALRLPRYLHETLEETIRLARQSPHVNQQSGVSVRASIAVLEAVVANAERRALVLAEPAIVPRISDAAHVAAALRGKLELVLGDDETAEEKLIAALLGEALRNVSESYFDVDDLAGIVDQFAGGRVQIEVGDDVAAERIVAGAAGIRGLRESARELLRRTEGRPDDPHDEAGAIEFVLEALHVHDKLSKYTLRERTVYKR